MRTNQTQKKRKTKDMGKHKSLSYQIRQRLTSLTIYGASKHEAKKIARKEREAAGLHGGQVHLDGIFSKGTFKNYDRQMQLFAEWAKKKHGARDLCDLMPLADEYMRERAASGLSAYTLKLDRAAIQKCFEPEGLRVTVPLPSRKRADIKKNRSEIKDFNMQKHEKLVTFGRITGLRRVEVQRLRYEDVDLEAGTVTVQKGKGGKKRTVTRVLDVNELRRICARGEHSPDEHIFTRVPCRYPEHRFRREYAQELYRRLARAPEDIPRSERYYCRSDKKGTVYDRVAMLEVSKQMGHTRVNVIAVNYL